MFEHDICVDLPNVLSHPVSRSDPNGGSESGPRRETIYRDSLPVFFFSKLNLYL